MALLPFRRKSDPPASPGRLVFRDGVPLTEGAIARRQDAIDLKAKLLSPAYTGEIYGPGVDQWDVKPDDLMENPDDLIARWGFRDMDQVCDDMAGNVLDYGGFVEGRLDVSMSLELSFLVGEQGDSESELARDIVQAAYEAIPERYVIEREQGRSAERGFAGAENIFDVVQTGAAKGFVSIVQMFNRPTKMFGFDARHRPYFIPHGARKNDPVRIDDFKVTFSRQGSLHTRYGKGYAQRCYPTVFAIDKLFKQHLAAVERWSWLPVIVKHPISWTQRRRLEEGAALRRQWKNILLVPDASIESGTDVKTMTDGAYANANATGTARMELIRVMTVALAHFVRGSMSTSGQDTGSNAKEATLDNAQLWKAPGDAAAREAMWNRGLIEPTMLANFPQMERSKWPRCTVDASFGEDLSLFMDLCERGAKLGLRIARVTWHDRTGIPAANDDDPAVLEAPAAPSVAPVLPDGLAADETFDAAGNVVRMSEPATIRIELEGGRHAYLRPSDPIIVDRGVNTSPGIVRAGTVVAGGKYRLVSAGSVKFA